MNRPVGKVGVFAIDDADGAGGSWGRGFEPAPMVRGSLPGPLSRALLTEQGRLESRARSYPRAVPVAFEEGLGATLRDVDGNTFIDFFAGAGVVNVGHGNPRVLDAAEAQSRKLVHALDFPTKARARLMRRLKPLLPGELSENGVFHFGGPTGSDAVEAAIKLARANTDREGIVAFQGAYHGMTATALSVSANHSLTGRLAGPVHFLPFPYPFRNAWTDEPDRCGAICARLLEEALSDPLSGVAKPAAVIVEPIQGEGGVIVPPPGFLPEVRRITREHEVLLIVDEIQTGFGRTGAMFAAEHEAISPDVVVLSKALGGIGYPLSCVAYDRALDRWAPGAHIGTFRGHQVAMAAGAAAIDFMLEHDLPARAGELGGAALALLREASAARPSIGEVRGRGLLIGVELVGEDRKPRPELASRVRRACADRGLICEVGGHFDNVVRLLPPLVIPRDLLERGVEILLDVLAEQEAIAAVPIA